jgi:hypothetical protein
MTKVYANLVLLIAALLVGFLPRGIALGSVEASSMSRAPASVPTATSGEKNREVSSFAGADRATVFARLKPVERDLAINFDEAAAMLKTRTINDKVFTKDFVGKMQDQYRGRVRPLEETANNPLWRPSWYEVQQYENGRHDVAQWTVNEAKEDLLRDFFNGADKDSSAMKVMSTARTLTGGEDDKPKEPQLTPEQKIARAHRLDLPAAAPEEEKIPTKVKTKINVLRQNGSVVFTNPVATTSLNGNRDDVSLNMNRDFRKISLRTSANYALKQECLNVNVSKQITDHISLDLDHYNYTGDKRDGSGYRQREQAKMNYSIGF